jgi:hypothetical protein
MKITLQVHEQDGGVGVGRQDGQGVERGDGRGEAEATNSSGSIQDRLL